MSVNWWRSDWWFGDNRWSIFLSINLCFFERLNCRIKIWFSEIISNWFSNRNYCIYWWRGDDHWVNRWLCDYHWVNWWLCDYNFLLWIFYHITANYASKVILEVSLIVPWERSSWWINIDTLCSKGISSFRIIIPITLCFLFSKLRLVHSIFFACHISKFMAVISKIVPRKWCIFICDL